METPRRESDQLPEEAPAEQVPDDDGGGSGREAEDSPACPARRAPPPGTRTRPGSDEPEEGH